MNYNYCSIGNFRLLPLWFAYPAIAAFFETEEGKREFEEWEKRKRNEVTK